MFDRYHRTVQETQALDLLPVMNLFLVLIPFLLLSAAFYHVGVIPASLPAQSPEESEIAKEPAVTMSLTIAPDFVELTASSDTLEPATLQPLNLKLMRDEDGYDTEGLQSHLKKVKASYPKSNTLVVLPHESLDYETLVTLLDACREAQAVPDPDGRTELVELFPVAVFSRFVAEGPEQPLELPPEEGP